MMFHKKSDQLIEETTPVAVPIPIMTEDELLIRVSKKRNKIQILRSQGTDEHPIFNLIACMDLDEAKELHYLLTEAIKRLE